MKKYLLNTLLAGMVLAGVGMPVRAAQPGATCGTAIELGDSFRENIEGTKTVWYSAWTFDLPLSVYFVPQKETDPKPDVEMDFSCTSGIYSDSIICSLFCANSGSGIQLDMPHKPALRTGTTDDGQFCYYLTMGKEYRDLLLKAGISYNVQVFVKVTFHSAGVISIAPDDLFTNCMDGAKFMQFADTVRVLAQDKERHVIVPYVQWQEDSIRYVWEGQSDCRIAIANLCEFDPMDATDGNIIDLADLKAGRDTFKVTSALLREYVQNQEDFPNEAGMYFLKWYSESAGVLKVEKVPMAPPQGGATLLSYDKATPVAANNPEALYAIPYTWTENVLFTTPTDHIFRMYIGNKYDFTQEEAIASYQFNATDNGHQLGLQATEMQSLWEKATGQYLYIRFECSAKTTITPRRWTVPECLGKAIEIKRPTTTISVEKGSYGAVYYRFYFREWENGEMTFQWSNSQGTCPTYIGDNCTFPANRNSDYVKRYQNIVKDGSWILSSAIVNALGAYADEDGYLYIRFSPSSPGTMTISTNAPEEEDPAPIVYPAATVAVACEGEPASAGQKYTIRVSAEQDITIYDAEPQDTAGKTAIDKWHQTPAETHTLTLPAGIYTLTGAETKIRIEVQ